MANNRKELTSPQKTQPSNEPHHKKVPTKEQIFGFGFGSKKTLKKDFPEVIFPSYIFKLASD